MASLLTFSLLLSLSLSTATPSPLLQQACKATRFQLACTNSLTKLNPQNPLSIIQNSIKISSQNLQTGRTMVRAILDSSKGSVNRTLAAKNCLESLTNSAMRTASAAEAAEAARSRVKESRVLMSASLSYQYDCWSGMKYANDTSQVGKTMLFFNDTLIVSTSNALSLLLNYDVFGDAIGDWVVPMTERDGFWEKGSGSGFRAGGVPGGLKADAVVCKVGKCGFKSVQEAVDSAPSDLVGKRFVVYIKEGVYDEIVRVGLDKKNVVFLGDGMGKTVITGSLNVGQPGVSTYNTATVGVLGDGFMASGLTIQNTAGPDAHQAVAFRSDSDLSVIENCEFLGNQDTLYAHSLRQFYKKCRIEGNVDFIFGNAAALFQDCQILVRPRQRRPEKGENNAVTAHGRTDPAQTTGFVFQNCLINGTEDYMKLYTSKPKVHKNYLGRPWKEFSRTVFIHCNFEALVTPQGWMPWSGDFALKTLYYGEFENAGPGAARSQRVPWSSQIPADHVSTYSVQNFIQGNDWIPGSSN